jgi:hypothetical protein
MTMNELVRDVAEELGASSQEALDRIMRLANRRYKEITSAIGLITTRREEVSKAATIGSRYLTFSGVERLDTVFRRVDNKNYILQEITNDEMLDLNVRDEPPMKYSIFTVSPASVTIFMDCIPTTTFTLYAHGLADVSTLSGTDRPAFPESFHDIIIYGVLADEFRRKEKSKESSDAEAKFTQRLSDLKMFIAKSAYLDQYRGKLSPAEAWWDTGKR